MKSLVINQRGRQCANTLLLIALQMFLAALGGAQTVALPEPPQVRAKNHVISLTLHAE